MRCIHCMLMVYYNRKTTKLKGRHVHPKGLNLAQEADMVSNNILNSSGFFTGPGNINGVGGNASMDNFIGKWNRMNSGGSGRFKRSSHVYDTPRYM